MIFRAAKLPGAYLIEPDMRADERGFFARTFCQSEFKEHGLNPLVAQCSISFNRRQGTLRGMHFQAAPYAETKLVRCTSGAIFDVIIDLRPESPSFRHHEAFKLTAENRKMVYVPEGFAHGFQTLVDDTEVFYQMSQVYVTRYARGVRWNDPAFGIEWPSADRIILERDQRYPDFQL